MPLTPNNREEHWLQGMVDGSTDLTPNKRKEYWYKEIVDVIGSGGGGGGGALVVTATESGGEYMMNKTAGEVYAAAQTGLVIVTYDGDYRPLVIASLDKGGYLFSIDNGGNWQPGDFVADTENDYPTTSGK